MEKLLLRVTEAAELASVGRTTAYELIASGEWPVVRVGKAVRIPLAGLRAWVEAQSSTAHGMDTILSSPSVATGIDPQISQLS